MSNYREYSVKQTYEVEGGADRYISKITNPHESVIYAVEKLILKDIMSKIPSEKKGSLLDFACGSGRGITFLKQFFKKSYGIDISKNLIQYSKKENPECEFFLCDIMKDKFPLKKKSLDVITTFRFLLNHKQIAQEALSELRQYLTDDGYLVLNQHMNRFSLIGFQFFVRRYIFGQKNIINSMSYSETKNILADCGYEVVDVRGYMHVPGRKNIILLPSKLLVKIEYFLSKLPIIKYFATNFMLVCKKKK